jgi:hypothetical protein
LPFADVMKSMLATSIFVAVLGMFQFGFNTGVINSPQKYIEQFINESYFDRGNTEMSSHTVTTLFSIAVCSCLVGGMIGGLSGGFVADRYSITLSHRDINARLCSDTFQFWTQKWPLVFAVLVGRWWHIHGSV